MSSPSRSGAFQSDIDHRVEAFTESISFDRRLFAEDIAGSIAHTEMLARQGLLTEEECTTIVTTLREIEREIEAGDFVFHQHLEDIHMNIEQALIDRLGDVGRKLHTGRSRNDQVATDLRLWVRRQIDELDAQLKNLQRAFVSRCERDADVVLPGYTHLRRAQPVLAAHYWLAYVEKFERDRQRLADCRRRTNVNSLGAAALAGARLPVDRAKTADALGVDGVAANSLDVSSDRDFLVEFVFCLSMVATHLSGWAEEWIIWSSTEFDFLELPHAFCTGSSIMPQKINPDVLELTRGRGARVVGALHALLVLLKGLPLAYNRDLQEDKRGAFDALDAVAGMLTVAIPLVEEAQLKRASITRRLDEGFLDATALMEYLILRGIPQRTAHHGVGQFVRLASSQSKCLAELSLAEFQSFSPLIDNSVYDVLGAENAMRTLASFGSSGPQRVREQVELWRGRLGLE